MRSQRAIAAGLPVAGGELRNRMREIFTSGSVGGAPEQSGAPTRNLTVRAHGLPREWWQMSDR